MWTSVVGSSVQFSRSVMSDSLRPHESQHARPPCPSPTPGVHSDSHPSSLWCHPAISSSVVPFSSCPQPLPASESFPMSQLFAWGGSTPCVLSQSIAGRIKHCSHDSLGRGLLATCTWPFLDGSLSIFSHCRFLICRGFFSNKLTISIMALLSSVIISSESLSLKMVLWIHGHTCNFTFRIENMPQGFF